MYDEYNELETDFGVLKKNYLQLKDIYAEYLFVYFLSNFDNWKKKYFLVYNELRGFWEYVNDELPSGYHEYFKKD